MVKSLKFLRHRRTEAGYFSEFLIAKTPGDVENCEPPKQPQQQPQSTVVFAPASTAVITSVQLLPQPHQSMAGYSLYGMQHHPTTVARHEVVVANANTGGDDYAAVESAALLASRPTPPRQRPGADTCGTRLARRRERNRNAAAKCRQRRQDRLDYLAECVRQLEADNGDLEAEVAELAAARAQLESTVRAHLARCDSSSRLSSTYDAAAAQAAAAAAAADFAASPLGDAASVWLAPPPPTPPAAAVQQQQPAAACRRPTSLSLSTSSSSSAAAEDASVVSMEIPSLTTPRTAGIGSGLTPFLATPLSAFKMESM